MRDYGCKPRDFAASVTVSIATTRATGGISSRSRCTCFAKSDKPRPYMIASTAFLQRPESICDSFAKTHTSPSTVKVHGTPSTKQLNISPSRLKEKYTPLAVKALSSKCIFMVVRQCPVGHFQKYLTCHNHAGGARTYSKEVPGRRVGPR